MSAVRLRPAIVPFRRDRRSALLTSVALAGLMMAVTTPHVLAQAAGGNGGGPAGLAGAGGSGPGVPGGNGTGDYGAGGGGADAAGGTPPGLGGAGGNGGTTGGTALTIDGGTGGSVTFTGSSAGFGGVNNRDDIGGGGGGAGGDAQTVPGTGPFNGTVNVTGGNGGGGGSTTFAPDTGSPAGGSYWGGSGGGGGAGLTIPGEIEATVLTGSTATGGQGGAGGNVISANAASPVYGTSAVGYGGNGGNGGAGVLLLVPDPTGSTTTIGSGAVVQGGQGGDGGYVDGTYGNSTFSAGYGGSGGQGGDGIRVLGSGTIRVQCDATGANCATVTGGTGGQAGSGTTQPGATGMGGSGIAVVTGATIQNAGSIMGGSGGIDFSGSSNGGGSGGAGVTGTGVILTNTGSVTGGFGGNANAFGVDLPGSGGAAFDGTQSTINNSGTITGGDAGSKIFPEFTRLAATAGGSTDPAGGVAATGSNLTIVNSGAMAGGLSTNGVQQTEVIVFTGGTNSLTLEAGWSIAGNADAFVGEGGSKGDILALGGNVSPATPFDVGKIVDSGTAAVLDGTGTPTAQFEGFGRFQKTGSSTWQLSGTTNYLTPWQVLDGTLAITSDANLGNTAGGVTLNGGTLEAKLPSGTTATITSARTFTIGENGGGLQTDPGVTLELTGQVVGPAGTGQLAKTGTGTLVLTGDNTYTGGTFIGEGTVEIGTASGLGTGDVVMATNTTLGFLGSFTFANNVRLLTFEDPTIDTGANTNTMSGVISGAGQLTKLGTGTLILTGINTYSGGTTITQGTLVGSATSFGSGGIVDNAALVFDQPTNANFNNPISGTGTVTKTGAGLLDLTGTNTYTGATTLAQGTLLVDGSTAGSVVTAQSGTTLGGFGTVGGIVAQSGSTVAPGLVVPYSTLNVAGNVNFQAGSTFRVQINAGGQTDRILATGTGTIDGGTVNVTAADGAYNAAQRFTILTAAAGRTGTFSNLTTTSNLAFLSPYLLYDPNDVIIAFKVQNPLSVPVCQTVNQRAAQSGIAGLGAGNQLYNTFLGQTIDGAKSACDATSGEIHASAAAAAFEDNRFPRESILDRLDDAAHDGPNAYGAVGAFGAAPGLPPGAQGYAPVHKGYDMPGVAAPLPRPAPYTAWGTGWGDFGQFRGNGNAATLDRSLGGFILGIDTRVDGAWFNNWHIGVAGGYSNDSLTVAGRASTGTFEMYYGGLYGGAQYGAFDVKFGALGGGTNLDTSRTIAFPGFLDRAQSSASGTMAQGFGEIGYKFGLPRGFIEPFAQGAAIYYGQDGFAETGGVAALRGFARDYNFETTVVGLKAESTPFANLPIIARAVLGWRHVFGGVTPGAVLAFEAGGPNFTVFGTPIDRDAVLAQAGLDYRATTNLTVGVSYSGQAGERAYDNAVKGRLEYRF